MSLTYSSFFYNIFLEGISPKEKIQKYKIDNPFLIQFILRYGEEIDWNKVKQTIDINSQVQRDLIPQFRSRLNSESHPKTVLYSGENMNINKEIELVRQAHPEHYDAISKIIQEKGKEEVKKYLVDIINKDKKSVLQIWLRRIDENVNDPIKQYLILKPIFDSTDSSKKKTPKPYIWMAVRDYLKNIEDSPYKLNNLMKSYESTLSNVLLHTERFKSIKSGNLKWIKIPGEKEDRENFESNVETLMGLSCNIWCISGKTMATHHLKNDGSFYLLLDVENKKPNALMAIRMKGDKIEEIRGELDAQKFDPVEMEAHLVKLTEEEENLNKYDVWEWINDERESRNLDKIIIPEISNFKEKVINAIRYELLKKRELDDVDQMKFSFLSDPEKENESLNFIIDKMITQLQFSERSPAMGVYIGDVRDVAEAFDDQGIKSYIKNIDGSSSVEVYGTQDFSIDTGNKIMNDFTLSRVIEEIKDNIDFEDEKNAKTVSIINKILSNGYGEDEPYGFLDDLNSEINLRRIDDDIQQLYDDVGYAFTEGVRRGIEQKINDMCNEHLRENFTILSGKYFEEIKYMIPLSLEELISIIQRNDEETLMYELDDIIKSDFKDNYTELDLDSAYYNYDFDMEAAQESYGNI
jgi:hypothetical protein